MQDQHFEEQVQGYVFDSKSGSALFVNFLKFIDVARLKKLHYFDALTRLALQHLTVEDIFETIAVDCVQNKKIDALQFLIQDCKLKDLVNFHLEDKMTLLHEACIQQAKDIALFLLSNNADPRIVNTIGTNAAHSLADVGGPAELFVALRDAGADLNKRNGSGLTPLHIAASKGHLALVKALIGAGANTSLKAKVEAPAEDGSGNVKYVEYNYAQMSRIVKSGSAKVDSIISTATKEDETHLKLATECCTGFLYKKRNQEIFQNYIKAVTKLGTPLDKQCSFLLVDSYFFTSACDPQSIKKVLQKNFQHGLLTRLNLILIVIKITDVFFRKIDVAAVTMLYSFALEHLAQETTELEERCQCYNVISGQSNKLGLVDLAKDAAIKGLAVSLASTDPITKSHLYYNLAAAHRQRLEFERAVEYLGKSYELCKDDEDTFISYVSLLLSQKKYSTALNVCSFSLFEQLARVMRLLVLYLMGCVSTEFVLSQLLPEYEDRRTNQSALELKTMCHLDLNNKKEALLCGKKLFDNTIKNNKDQLSMISVSIFKMLRDYLECEVYDEALVFLEQYINHPSLKLGHNFYFLSFAAIIYFINGFPEKAEKLLAELEKSNFNRQTLATLYITFALASLNEQRTNYKATQEILKIAIRIDPTNDEIEVYQALIHAIDGDQNALESLSEKFDTDLLNNIALTYDLFKKQSSAEEESSFFDPVKVHEFFQAKKKEYLSEVADHLCPPLPRAKAVWQINDVKYDEENPKVINLNSKFYPDFYAVISPKIDLDEKTLNRFQIALSKGLCKRRLEQNGIKFLQNSVIELKIDDDIRVHTSTVYRNADGKTLIIFDQVGNHQSIQKLLQSKKSITTVKLDPIKKDADYPDTFFRKPAAATVLKEKDTSAIPSFSP